MHCVPLITQGSLRMNYKHWKTHHTFGKECNESSADRGSEMQILLFHTARNPRGIKKPQKERTTKKCSSIVGLGFDMQILFISLATRFAHDGICSSFQEGKSPNKWALSLWGRVKHDAIINGFLGRRNGLIISNKHSLQDLTIIAHTHTTGYYYGHRAAYNMIHLMWSRG